jgi:tRNA (mo5U34)-methyltransferase
MKLVPNLLSRMVRQRSLVSKVEEDIKYAEVYMNNSTWEPIKPAPAPPDFSPEDFFSGVHWHQRWEVFQGIHTPGINPVRALSDYIQLPPDLRGVRVLDIGAWNGCFSFECERRGASEVVALSPEDPEQVGFYRLKDAIGSKAVRYEKASVYNLDADRLGKFDLILFLGVLYHLRYPLLAIDQIRKVAKGTVLVETHVIDNCFIPAGKGSKEAIRLRDVSNKLPDVPVWQFYRHGELDGGESNWFGPNIRAVIDSFESAGFETRLVEAWSTRASFNAFPKTEKAEFFQKETYEGQFSVIQESVGL